MTLSIKGVPIGRNIVDVERGGIEITDKDDKLTSMKTVFCTSLKVCSKKNFEMRFSNSD